jgi:hypothetical protein
MIVICCILPKNPEAPVAKNGACEVWDREHERPGGDFWLHAASLNDHGLRLSTGLTGSAWVPSVDSLTRAFVPIFRFRSAHSSWFIARADGEQRLVHRQQPLRVPVG